MADQGEWRDGSPGPMERLLPRASDALDTRVKWRAGCPGRVVHWLHGTNGALASRGEWCAVCLRRVTRWLPGVSSDSLAAWGCLGLPEKYYTNPFKKGQSNIALFTKKNK